MEPADAAKAWHEQKARAEKAETALRVCQAMRDEMTTDERERIATIAAIARAAGIDPDADPLRPNAALVEDVRALHERAKRAEARERFAWTALRAPTPEPCRNCGRVVLLGPPCCDMPDLPPYPPPVAELAQALRDAEERAEKAEGERAALDRILARLERRTDTAIAERNEARAAYDALLSEGTADAVAHLTTRTARLERELNEARAQLAALRETASHAAHQAEHQAEHGGAARSVTGESFVSAILRPALDDTAKAAREHEARVRAKALREAADRLRHRVELHGLAGEPGFGRLLEALERGLRAMADEAEKGGA